jgi:alkylation response protein AidB-like acyl-CoA dehydrogenase
MTRYFSPTQHGIPLLAAAMISFAGWLQVVSAACGPRRSDPGAGAGDRQDQRSGIAAGDRRVLAMSKAAEWTARRARTAQEQERPQGPEGSLGKLASSIIARAAARVHTSLLGPDALLTEDNSPMSGLLAEILVSVPASSIAGGTDEIQRNIIGERVLKMPRERTGDTDKPFKDVPRNTVA